MDSTVLLGLAANLVMIIAAALKKRKRKLLESEQNPEEKRNGQKNGSGKGQMEGGVLSMLDEELLHEDPAAYQNFLRLKNLSFEKLLEKVEPFISKKETLMRDVISARNRLETTLRFLATGETYRSLMYSTRIHESTISKFIPEVCKAIFSVLQNDYLKTPSTEEEWIKIAEGFEQTWQFPNCIGALDGRHIKFRPPTSAGSFYYNYKGDHSLVLLALVDSAYKFTYYNVGVNGRVSDGGVFARSSLSKALQNNQLHLPPNAALPGTTIPLPYVIVADDAFPLTDNIMKPFPSRGLSYEEKVFNYRLSRARRMVESSFGILTNRFRVLLNPINLNPEKVETITLACLALHNFLLAENPRAYSEVRTEGPAQSSGNTKPLERVGNRSRTTALKIREEYKEYFNSDAGQVEWQRQAVERHNM